VDDVSKNNEITLAVLPFENLTEGNGLAIFCRGFHMDLITELSRFRQFKLIASESLLDTKITHADYTVKGSFRYQHHQLKINAQLINNRNDHVAWADRFEGDKESIFAIQESVLKEVVSTLQQQLNHDLLIHIKKKSRVDLTAYEHWLYGMQELKKGTLDADPERQLPWHYWLHRSDFLWKTFHQMHHSAERLDTYGAFFFSPFDMIGWTVLGSICFSLIAGLSPQAITVMLLATNFLSIFQHSNIKTPRWLGYIIQRPESHTYHHAMGIHRFNYSDLPLFDIIFRTFRNPATFEHPTGFYNGASARIFDMLRGRDVSKPGSVDQTNPKSSTYIKV
jgi:TolB-like protein